MNSGDLLTTHYKINDDQKKALKHLGILSIRDLIYHFPSRYGNTFDMKNISDVTDGETVEIYGMIEKLKTGKTFKTKMAFAEAIIRDETGSAQLKWFHQPYIAKLIKEKELVKISGKAMTQKNGTLAFLNPHIEHIDKAPIGVGDSLFSQNEETLGMPVYGETRGITSLWFYHAIAKAFKKGILDSLVDPIPEDILKKYTLPSLRTALIWIHHPRKKEDSESAKKRFAFEEIFFIQLKKQQERRVYEESPSFIIEPKEKEIAEFVKRFPFSATEAQHRAIKEIMTDFGRGYAMSRLLEGDVGSGKTAVAAVTTFAVVTTAPDDNKYGNLQVAYMAPTEILAKQHFESRIERISYV